VDFDGSGFMFVLVLGIGGLDEFWGMRMSMIGMRRVGWDCTVEIRRL
jgi:hypothetical protein